jgi:uncharacterized protein YbcI
MSGSESPTRVSAEPAAALANAVVRLLAQYTGRGPTKARAYINRDLISVVLQDTLTTGEKNLVAAGKIDLVLATRKQYQLTMRDDLVAAVEQITGRRVLAFLSDNHIDPDVAVETFVLEPELRSVGDGDGKPPA